MLKGEHAGLGIASLVLGIIAIITCTIPYFLMAFVFKTSFRAFTKMNLVNTFIFGTLPLVFGAVSYWGKRKDSFGRTGLKLGLISTIVNTMMWILIFFAASLSSL